MLTAQTQRGMKLSLWMHDVMSRTRRPTHQLQLEPLQLATAPTGDSERTAMVMPCQDLSHGWHQGLRLVVRCSPTRHVPIPPGVLSWPTIGRYSCVCREGTCAIDDSARMTKSIPTVPAGTHLVAQRQPDRGGREAVQSGPCDGRVFVGSAVVH